MNRYISCFFISMIFCSTALQAQPFERICSEVRTEGDAPQLFINGKPYPPYAYMSYLGGEKFYEEMAGAGLHLYNIPAYLGETGINYYSGIGPFRPAIWIGKGKYVLSRMTNDFDETLKPDTTDKVIISIHLDRPTWWEREKQRE